MVRSEMVPTVFIRIIQTCTGSPDIKSKFQWFKGELSDLTLRLQNQEN